MFKTIIFFVRQTLLRNNRTFIFRDNMGEIKGTLFLNRKRINNDELDGMVYH